MKRSIFVIIVLLLLLVVTSCSVSKEEAIEKAKVAFHQGFERELQEPTYTSEQIELYIPREMEVTEEAAYNILLEKSSQIFLLFFNPAEGPLSEMNLNRDREFEKEASVFEVVEKDDLVAYQMISAQAEEGQYKMIIGIGGAKLTTIAPINELEESTNIMIDILQSMEYVH